MRSIAIILGFATTGLFGQDATSRHCISIESLSLGGWVSVNYHYQFNSNSVGFFDFKAGMGSYDFGSPSFGFPLHLSFNGKVGKKNHFLEFGFAGSYVMRREFSSTNRNYYLVTPEFGYRSISKNGLLFRAFVSYPIFSSEPYSNKPLFLWPIPSIAIGKVIGRKKR